MIEVKETITIDGYKIDAETGEVIGMVEEFHVTDEKSAEWVLEKLTGHDSEIARLEIVRDSVTDRIDKQIKEAQRKGTWLRLRFGNEIEEYAKANLPKGKRTLNMTWGSISFTATRAKLTLVDEELAMLWASNNYPEAIKTTRTILKSNLPEAVQEEMLDSVVMAGMRGFAIVPAGENMKIKTVDA